MLDNFVLGTILLFPYQFLHLPKRSLTESTCYHLFAWEAKLLRCHFLLNNGKLQDVYIK